MDRVQPPSGAFSDPGACTWSRVIRRSRSVAVGLLCLEFRDECIPWLVALRGLQEASFLILTDKVFGPLREPIEGIH